MAESPEAPLDGPAATGPRVRAPRALTAQARRFIEAGGAPAVPRLAATVILLRPASGSGGFEVYAQRRAETMAFAPGMYVFPGGTVDPRDESADVGWTGPTPAWWAERLALPEPSARAVVCAAVREVFEECGVLLAGPDESTVVGDVAGADWEAARVALLAREVALAELLAERGLTVRSDLLAPWARWLTPEFEPRRYDTYFFLARMPVGQVTRDVGGEAVHAVWAPPRELAPLKMLPPTAYTLRELAGYTRLDDAIVAGAGRDVTRAVAPRLEFDGDESWFLLS
jgi:8-oxo-dGTP pyrophosphatase MutT (NUDIX family)